MVLEATQPITKSDLIVACIPAYNEEKTIASVIIKLRKYVDKIIVCDDGSSDSTSELVSSLGADLLRNEENKGKGYSLSKLLEAASSINAKVIVTIDADGQHDPVNIPTIIAPILNNEADVVIGSRYVQGAHTDIPFYRKLGLKVVNILNQNGKIKDTQSGFRAFSLRAVKALQNCTSNGYGIESEQLSKAIEYGFTIREVPINVQYKGLNTSKKHPISHGVELIETAIKLLVEKRPLSLLGLPGTILFFIGLGAAGYVLWFFNTTRYFSIPIALVSFGGIIVGMFFIMTALILYGIRSFSKK